MYATVESTKHVGEKVGCFAPLLNEQNNVDN